MNEEIKKDIENWVALYQSGKMCHTDSVQEAFQIFSELLGRKEPESEPEQKVEEAVLVESTSPARIIRSRLIYNISADGRFLEGSVFLSSKFDGIDLKPGLEAQGYNLFLLPNGDYTVLPNS
jgi:hypothetical protein